VIRLAFSLSYGLAYRNLVSAGVLARIAHMGIEAVAYLPPIADVDRPGLTRELPPGTTIRHLHRSWPSNTLKLLKFYKQYFYRRRTGLESFEVRRKFRRRGQPLFHAAATIGEWVAAALLSERQIDAWLDRLDLPDERQYVNELRQDAVEALVVTKPGYLPDELPLIKAARRLRLPVISADTTWDNMVSKRPPYLPVDVMTVWNQDMADQADRYYGLARAARVTGGPQFDTFFTTPALDRRSWLTACGFDPERPVIVFALNNPALTPGNIEYIQLVAEASADGRITARPNVIVRLHPWDRDPGYDAVAVRWSHVRIDRPFGTPATGTAYECLPTRERVAWHGSLLQHSNVLINIASTSSLDGVAADRPVVNLSFDSVPTHPDLSVARYCQYSHFKPILDTGAVRSVATIDEMIAVTNRFLADPSADSALRGEARRRFLTFEDDQSAARVAGAIAAAAGFTGRTNDLASKAAVGSESRPVAVHQRRTEP